MAQVQQINIVACECNHRRGLIGSMFGWLWGPCGRCRMLMNGNVILVPSNGAATVAVNPGMATMRVAPVVVSRSTTQYVAMPQQQLVAVAPNQATYVPQVPQANNYPQASQEAYPSTLPPKYSEKMPIQ